MKYLFTVEVSVDKPIVVGQDKKNGRRQLIPITGGTVKGTDINGEILEGVCMPGGVDSQIIRPDGKCELSARYGVRLNDGRTFFIENNGIRTVPSEYVEKVVNGEFVDPSLYYFVTTPKFEAFDDSLRWLENNVLVCKAERMPETVKIHYCVIE